MAPVNSDRTAAPALALAVALAVALALAPTASAQAAFDCASLVQCDIDTHVTVRATQNGQVFHAVYVNVLAGGTLEFVDDGFSYELRAASILVESGGALVAGSTTAPFGAKDGANAVLTLTLYGDKSGGGSTGVPAEPIMCQSNAGGPCGVPQAWWDEPLDHASKQLHTMPNLEANGVDDPTDYFYAYENFTFSDSGAATEGYFGRKVLAVSFNGSLEMYGRVGAVYPSDPGYSAAWEESSGTSWRRVAAPVAQTAASFSVASGAQALNWPATARVVLTTTDYLPSHNELLTVTVNGNTLTP